MSERGVSNTIGFVFVFSLIILVASVVSVSGFGVLRDVRDAERINNAERAFDVLADNIGDIQSESAPSRSTEIKLADASVGTADATEITVTIAGTDYPTDGTPIRTEPIVYSAENTRIIYEAGAVIRQEESGAVMVRNPPLLATPQRTALQFVRLESPSGSGGRAGTTTILVQAVQTDSQVHAVERGTDIPVTIEVKTAPERAAAWSRYFEEEIGSDVCSTSGGTVTCSYDTDVAILSTTTVDVKISG
ncbi:MAG: hypothetical protein ABEJ22_07285 [Haloferacaceae archaeon]